MNARERVLLAIRHREPDRIPLDWNGEAEVSRTLQARLGLHSHEELLRALHVDLRHSGLAHKKGRGTRRRERDGTIADIWGVRRAANELHGGYVVHSPLAQLQTEADLDAYDWPDPGALDYESYPARLDAVGDYARVGGGGARLMWTAIEMVGLEKYMIMLVDQPDLIHSLMRRITGYCYEVGTRCYPLVRGKLDLAHHGSDFGTQLDTWVSLPMWREFVKPYFARLFTLAKEHGIGVYLHSDGAIRRLIPDLIEIGVDVLNPIQVGAAGMEPVALKRDFGAQITLHGTIDVQHTLPHGSTEDVRREVIERCMTLGPGGGFIMSCSHSFLPDQPPPNILTMYDTAYRAGRYGHLGELLPA